MEGLKAQDLRIGNTVDYNGMFLNVAEIIHPAPRNDRFNDEWVIVLYCDGFVTAKLSELEPITLTEERLIKFGFILNNEWEEITNPGVQYEKDIKYHNVKKYESKDYDNRFIYFIVEHGFIYCYVTPRYLTKIKNVHQLQNIFYSIKGSELVMDN